MSTQIEHEIRQNELLTVKEVANYLRVSQVTVWRWCQRDILPATRVGRTWRIRRNDLLHLLDTSLEAPLTRTHDDGQIDKLPPDEASLGIDEADIPSNNK